MSDADDNHDPTPWANDPSERRHRENLIAIAKLEKAQDRMCDRLTALEFKMPDNAAIRLDRIERDRQREAAEREKADETRRNIIVGTAVTALCGLGSGIWSLIQLIAHKG